MQQPESPLKDLVRTQKLFSARSFLASLDRRSENVRVLQIVIGELEFGNIERHVFAAPFFVVRANHAALENRPETLDGLSVDCADDILPPLHLQRGSQHARAPIGIWQA
jgi:hypothetical protein